MRLKLLLLIYMQLSTVQNYTTIHLELNQAAKLNDNHNDLSNEVCVPNKTEDLNIN